MKVLMNEGFYYFGGILGGFRHLSGEDLHDLGIKFGHDDLQSLIGLIYRHRFVQRVQVPAVAVDSAQCVSRPASEQLLQTLDLLFERSVRRLLQLGAHEALARVENVLNGVKAAELVGRLDDRLYRVQQRGGAACLDEQALLVDEQAALAQHVRVEVARAATAQDLAVDQVEYVVDALAWYVAQVILHSAL